MCEIQYNNFPVVLKSFSAITNCYIKQFLNFKCVLHKKIKETRSNRQNLRKNNTQESKFCRMPPYNL